jgi:acyl carrier protein
MMDAQSDARALLADAVNVDVAALPEGARIGAFEHWDSLAHLRLILALEQHIGRQLDPDEAIQIECLDDIARLLKLTARAD